MIFVPYNTDAPLYHPPFATVGLIIINVVMFFFTTFQFMLGNIDEESLEWLILMFDTINPLQWLTAAFMHADFSHLIGNMIFLWAFGLVVEGKVGPTRFTILYVALAMLQSAIVQIPMFILGGESGALGASGAIYALMVIAVIWAPENEMECFYWVGLIFWGTFEVRIFILGLVFIALQMVMLFFNDFAMSSAMLHMAGVVIGIPAGICMLRYDWVDCEGWDLISKNPSLQQFPILFGDKQRARVRTEAATIHDPIAAALALGKGRPDPRFPGTTSRKSGNQATQSKPAGTRSPQAATHQTASRRTASQASRRQSTSASRASAFSADTSSALPGAAPVAELPQVTKAKADPQFNGLAYMLRQSVESNNAAAAQQAFLRMDQQKLSIGISDKVLFAYVTLLGKRKQYVEALRPLQIVALRNGPYSEDAKLRIAQIQLKVLNNPAAAIRVLQSFAPLDETATPARQTKFAKRNELLAAAQRMTLS